MAYQKKVFNKIDVEELLNTYGSPLYVYDEEILRQRCREMKNLVSYPNFRVNYSAKANTNVELLKIIREEGLDVDAMSPGEMYLEMKAGFSAEQITFIGNNVSPSEFEYAVSRGIYVSVDSLSQLETLGRINPGGKVSLRINPGIGVGHHEKVVTGGKKAKFGITVEDIPRALEIAGRYNMKINGLNHHIGSLFLQGDEYIAAATRLLNIARTIPGIEIVDIGGGFGIPYRHKEEKRLDLAELGQKLDRLINDWVAENHPITLKIEPGRYVVAECGATLGRITSIKNNYNTYFIGCDVGFNTMARPFLYDAYHEVSIAPLQERDYSEYQQPVYLVGPICESGDILVHDRPFPVCQEGDALIIHDTGAYGFVMASVYNSRPLPAEVLIRLDGSLQLIRSAQRLEDLYRL